MDKYKKALKEKGIKFEENKPLKEFTTTKVGGPARLFIVAKSEKEIIFAINNALKNKIEYLVLGGGSNLLFSDEVFGGVVILNKTHGISESNGIFAVKSGTLLSELIGAAIEKGFSGLEQLVGIPGTVGGAIYGNAGAYGKSISDHLLRVKVFDGKNIVWIDKKDCSFSYRESIFKKSKEIILEVEFSFKKKDKKLIRKDILKILSQRKQKFSSGLYCPGSFFKNIQAKNLSESVLARIPKEKIIHGKIPTGYLLENVVAKRLRVGGVRVLDSHANFFVNEGKGKAEDFYKLAMILKNRVKEKYNINLEPEVQLMGFSQKNKKVKSAVIGLGIEGKDLVNYLLKNNYEVTIFDKKRKEELDFKGIDAKKVKLVIGKNYLENGFEDFDLIFRSPGVYRYEKELKEAEEKGVEISSAIKLFFKKHQPK